MYRCHAVYQNILYEESINDPEWRIKPPIKYAIVFNMVIPPIFKQTIEHYGLKSENYSNCEICKIMDIESYRKFLIDIRYYDDPRFDTAIKVFLDKSTFPEIVYKQLPKYNFHDDWKLQAKHPNEEFYRHIVVDGPKRILYENAEPEHGKDEKETSPKEAVNQTEDNFIKSLRFYYEDSSQIKIQEPGKQAKLYTYTALGFNDIITDEWEAFRDILQGSNTYYVGQT